MFVDRGGLTLITSDTRLEAWEVTLDRIELDVIRAEVALANNAEVRIDEWDVPADHGPIPLALQSRAQEIIARQHELIAALAERLGATVRQQAVVDRVGRTSTRSHVPVYVDVSA